MAVIQKKQYNPTQSARTKQPAHYGRRLNWQYDISMICRSFETLWLSFVTFWCPVVIINCANAQPPLCALITDFKDDAFMNLWNSTCCKLNCFAQAKITWREGRSKVGTLPSALLKVIFDMHCILFTAARQLCWVVWGYKYLTYFGMNVKCMSLRSSAVYECMSVALV